MNNPTPTKPTNPKPDTTNTTPDGDEVELRKRLLRLRIDKVIFTNEKHPKRYLSEESVDDIMLFVSAHTEAKVREARINENRYYAKLLKLNAKSADDKNTIKVSLRKIFEYRLKQLAQPPKEES